MGTEMKSTNCLRATCLTLLMTASAVWAQSAPVAERYSPMPVSRDGIGKSYMGREISAVMGWQGGEAAVFALDWERTVRTLPWQHVVVFRKRN